MKDELLEYYTEDELIDSAVINTMINEWNRNEYDNRFTINMIDTEFGKKMFHAVKYLMIFNSPITEKRIMETIILYGENVGKDYNYLNIQISWFLEIVDMHQMILMMDDSELDELE